MQGFQPTKFRKMRPDIIAPVALVLVGFLFFHDFFFTSKNLYFRDILNFHYPLRKVLIDAFAQGGFPLWNPHIALGQPMLANPNYMAFYPTNLLHLFLPFNYAFKLHFVLHPILGGLGLYFLQRRLDIRPAAAFTGALAYELSGTVISFLNLYNIVPAVALLPWIAWAFLGALQQRPFKRSLLFGALLALEILAFEPLMAQCLLLLLAGMAALHLLEQTDRPAALRRILRVGLSGAAFALGLAAVQVLPTLELLPLSARGALDYAEAGGWSTHPLDLLGVIVPNLFGHFYTIGFVQSWGEAFHHGRESYLVSFFLGTGVILLAAVSMASARRKLLAVLTALATAGLILSLGSHLPFHQWMFHNVPFFSLGRYPSKFFLLAALALCILSSLGVESLLERSESRKIRNRKGLAVPALVLAGLGACFLAWFKTHPEVLERWIRAAGDPAGNGVKDYDWILSFLWNALLTSTLFSAIYGTLLLMAHRIQYRLLILLIPLLIAAELIPANLRLTPLISEANINHVSEMNRTIAEKGPKEPFRVVPPLLMQSGGPQPNLRFQAPNQSSAWLTLYYRMTGQPMYGIMDGIHYSVDHSVDSLNTKESETLWEEIRRLPQPKRLDPLRRLNSPWILSMEPLAFEGLTPIVSMDTISQRQVHAYWLQQSLQRAYFTSGTEFVPSPDAALERLLDPSFAAGAAVILEGEGSSRSGTPGAGSVTLKGYSSTRVVCEVSADLDGHLVLLDSYYPGWEARVDGKPAEIRRANYAFRAVPVAAGRHVVEFRYCPRVFYLGLVISAVFLLAGGLVATHALLPRHRRRGKNPTSA
ncbi:MAG: YfhO family protein [Acidobacteria bacterium]|nr:YfhO family protein [Acidobacteriota bacterium]